LWKYPYFIWLLRPFGKKELFPTVGHRQVLTAKSYLVILNGKKLIIADMYLETLLN